MRFLSHHDLMRLMTRALRRTALPLRFSEGYTPRPILSFPLALAVGLESLDEVMEIELSDPVAPGEILERLNSQLPEGVRILRVVPFERKARARVRSVEYRFVLDPVPDDLPRRIERVMALASMPLERRNGRGLRSIDIRPYLETLAVDPDGLVARVKVTDQGTARPGEVATALDIPEGSVRRIVKIRTHFEKDRESHDAH
jgi:radical SAM-linked protein